jgi:citrate lyase beta subunit
MTTSSAKTSLSASSMRDLVSSLAEANALVSAKYPIDAGRRQAVHTVYGGAHLFKADLAPKLGRVARRTLDEYGADPMEFSRAIGLTQDRKLAETIHGRVVEKLAREPVEDFRIDFEDGYGNRSDEEEDGHAIQAALETARARKEGTMPPFSGIRIKPFSEELCRRSLRTLDIYVTTLVEATDGALPDHFVVTLPKITTSDHVSALVNALDQIERTLGLNEGSLRIELMIETTQSILDLQGRSPLGSFLDVADGRCVAAHFGTYDYTASCNITAAHQHMTHSACDFARHMMQVAYSGRGIWLSDGATNIMPIAPHRRGDGDPPLTDQQQHENRRTVHDAWRLHVEHIRHSLVHGYYQGWDLHPGQLPTRYAAVYAFFLEALPAASERLKNFVAKAAQATLVGDVFDDAATGQGLLNFFLRGINCGAFPESEALATGVTIEELRGRSFVQILKNRRH